MKKVVSASIVLMAFSASMILFQISCQDEVIAKESKQKEKILYSISVEGDWQIWIGNSDGSAPQQINIALPSPHRLVGPAKLTSDGQTLIFGARNPSTLEYYIYSLTLNGSVLKKLVDAGKANQLEINQLF